MPTVTIPAHEWEAVLNTRARYQEDAIGHWFWSGASVEQIAKAYDLPRIQVEETIRWFMSRRDAK